MEFGVRVWFRFGAKIVSEPHLNRTGPQRGLQFGLRARTRPSSGSGFGENCLRTGLHRTVASLARHHSHSLPGEPKTGIVSRLKTQQGTTATHRLESQRQALLAGQKHSKAPQPLTFWRAKDRHCQQARNIARHHSHSPTEEPRTGIFNRLETQQGTMATHFLESQGQALSAG